MVIPSHITSKVLAINDVDPDDGNDWKCDACRLPIFATPFVDPDGDIQGRTQHLRSVVISSGHMHEQCANKIPAKLEEHPLHPMAELTLLHVQPDDDDNNTHDYYCSRCGSKCGSKFYKCRTMDYRYIDLHCGFTLDLLCASPITIVHQSHNHELTATRGSFCSFICCACGTQHDKPALGEWGLSYVCSPCDFWIHPDCAVLPNAIEIVDDKVHVHDHPLLLSYGNKYRGWEKRNRSNVCAICEGEGDSKKCSGWYRCFHCEYSVHIKCVVYSDPPHSFKPVLLRDAKVPGLIHLPMANEHQSVIQRIMNSTEGTSSYNSKVHQHPLVINQLLRNNNNNDDDDDDDDDDDGDDRVCDACVQIISPSDAFYRCNSKVNNNNNSCRDFFVHSCCAQLPDEITTKKCNTFNNYHTLSLLVSGEEVGKFSGKAVGKFPFDVLGGKYLFERTLHNGFAYFCKECNEYIDVIKALMPASITHDAHVKSHILCITYGDQRDLICICCKRNPMDVGYITQIGYKCNNCNNFYIHTNCALLPDKVTHHFDRHSLKLITTTSLDDLDHHQHHHHQEEEEEEQVALCEICEENLDDDTGSRWFYGCKKCDQSFHVDCIPYFDKLSKIKFGFTIRVKGHNCPLACVRALSVEGYRCAHCPLVIRESENSIKSKIAFECAECDYRIHGWPCAKELLLED